MKTNPICSSGGDDTHLSPLNTPTSPSASPDATPSTPNHDDLLAALSTHERALLTEWFHTTKRLEDIAKKCAEPPPKGFGISFSFEALGQWEHLHLRNNIRLRQIRAEELAHPFAPNANNNSLIDPAALQALKLRLFELSVRPQSDVGEIKTLFLLILEARNHEIAERKLQISLDEISAELSATAKFMEPGDLQQHTRRVLGDFADPNRTPSPSLNPVSIPL